MSRSKVKVTWDKNALSAADTPGACEWFALAANSVQHQRACPFRAFQRVFSGVVRQFYAGGKISACCLVIIMWPEICFPV